MKVQAFMQRLKNSLGVYSSGELFDEEDLLAYINFGLAYIDAYKDWGFNIRRKTFTSPTDTTTFTVGNLYKVLSVNTKTLIGDESTATQTLVADGDGTFSIKDGIIELGTPVSKITVVGNFGFKAYTNSSEDLNSELPIPFILEGVLFDFAMSYAIVKYIDTGYTLSQTFVSRATSILERVSAKLSSEVVLKSISIKSK